MESFQEHYESLQKTLQKYMPGKDMTLIEQAITYAEQKHKEQKRKDGSPYIIHPLAVAEIVAEMGLDTDAVLGALLHDCIEDTDASRDEIAKLFGDATAEMVEGVTKLTRANFSSSEERQMENLRKMFMAMSKDIRVVLIKTAAGSTICAPCSIRPRKSRSASAGRQWISMPPLPTVLVCRR